jgi:aminopeptidase N
MRDYVSSYAHREATTADFQAVVERHVGQSMQWFFDQWVYGVQIPRYEYSWERERNADGQWIVRGRVDQFDVDSTFRVHMPITLVFEEGRRTFVQEISGSGAQFSTPPLGEKPSEVVFNDYLTILCREKIVRKP